MNKTIGEGAYLLLVDYGQEGWSIIRFSTKEALLQEVLERNYHGEGMLLAHELELTVREIPDAAPR